MWSCKNSNTVSREMPAGSGVMVVNTVLFDMMLLEKAKGNMTSDRHRVRGGARDDITLPCRRILVGPPSGTVDPRDLWLNQRRALVVLEWVTACQLALRSAAYFWADLSPKPQYARVQANMFGSDPAIIVNVVSC